MEWGKKEVRSNGSYQHCLPNGDEVEWEAERGIKANVSRERLSGEFGWWEELKAKTMEVGPEI